MDNIDMTGNDNRYIIIDNKSGKITNPSYVHLESEITVLDIISFYYYLLYPNLNFLGESHNYYEIFICLSGKAKAKVGNQEYVLNECEFIISKPGVNHIHSPEHGFLSSISIGFSATGINDDLICNKVGQFSNEQMSILNFFINDYINNLEIQNDYSTPRVKKFALKNEYGYKQALKNCMELLLILITRNQLKEAATQNVNILKRGKENQNKVVQYIKDHYKEKISLDELSKIFNYSVGHLCRKFKKETGDTIVEYITKYRISMAMKLLFERKDYSIEYIAFEVGFNDVLYFTKSFKKYVGISPGKYRHSVLSANAIHAQDVVYDIIKNINN